MVCEMREMHEMMDGIRASCAFWGQVSFIWLHEVKDTVRELEIGC